MVGQLSAPSISAPLHCVGALHATSELLLSVCMAAVLRLIDSWWHAFDDGEYFEDVPAQVGQLFPHGLAWLYKMLGEQSFGAHWSSTFSSASPYVANFSGWVSSSTANGSYVPVNQAVWDHIFASDTTWGMRTIKIDHLYEAFLGHGTPPYAGGHLELLSEPYLAHEFLGSIGEAAERHGVDIMWCMSYPNVLMQSVMYPAMTHGRGSSDSHPNDQNWRGFGGESMFEWALGLWPFKDTFYTNTSRGLNLPLNGQDKGQREQQPYTHTVVAALSGGGVAPGDVIGGTDVGLVLSTCRTDGTLLKPTTPAAFIDRYWLEHATPSPPPPRPNPSASNVLRLQACVNSTAQEWSVDTKTGLVHSSVANGCLNLAHCLVGGTVHLGYCSTQCSSPECCGGNNTRWSLVGDSHTAGSAGAATRQIRSRACCEQCLSNHGSQGEKSQIGVAPCSPDGANLLSWDRLPDPSAKVQIKASNGSCLTVEPEAGNTDFESESIGEVASGETVLQGHIWKYVTVIPPNAAFSLTPADVGLRSGGTSVDGGYLVYSRHLYSDPPVPANFSSSEMVAVSSRASLEELQYWVAAPVLDNGWTILGERGKVVPIASQRLVSFQTTSGSGSGALVVELVGAANESVTMDFARPDRRTLVSATCNTGPSGRARLTIPGASAAYSCLKH